ncbi:MAG: protein kinase [Verrucomicrobia bacterium]|nr:protein kinase [Verrucomicrobiota bacterium]
MDPAVTSLQDQALVAEYLGEVLEGPPLRYHLLRRLGEGSFGTVWLASQEDPVKREVAVKILKTLSRPEAASSRFDVEIRSLARLKHPGIAILYETGVTTSGSRCLIMEWVDGTPLNTYCDSRTLGIRERVRLIAQVADAVSHAHQMLVMHRDLKPSNILVTEATGIASIMPKVIDFGIARLLDETDLNRTCWTFTGEVLGTFDYMSPEQAAGDPTNVTVRADIFSLGAVLFELLIGQTLASVVRKMRPGKDPMRALSIDDVLPSAKSCFLEAPHEEQQRLARLRACSTRDLQEVLGKDLGAVVMKACSPDMALRYDSMAEFQADLCAWLEDLPVSALPPSQLYFLKKYVHRHRLAAASLVVVLSACFIAAGMILRYADQARSSEKIALEGKAMAEELKKQAESSANQARAAQTEAEASSKLLLKALNSPFPTQQGRDVTVLQVLDQALRELREDQALPLNRRTSMLHTLGSVFYTHSRYEAAAGALEESVRLRRLLYGPNHPQTLWENLLLARSWIYTGRRPQALALADSSLLLIHKLDHPEADNLEYAARDLKISCLYFLHDHPRAVEFGRDCVKYSRSQYGDEHPNTLRFLDELAANLVHTGHSAEAAGILESILPKIRERLEPNDSKASIVACRLASIYLNAGEPAKALPLAEAAVVFARRVYAPSHGQTCFFTRTFITSLLRLGRGDEALSVSEVWLSGLEGEILTNDEQIRLTHEIPEFLELPLPEHENSRWRSVKDRCLALMPAITEKSASTSPEQIVPAAALQKPLVFNLQTAVCERIALGHLESEVREHLPSASWNKISAEVPGCYRLMSPDYRGLELTFRTDGVLLRLRVDLTTGIFRLHPELGDNLPKAVAIFGKPVSEDFESPTVEIHTFKHQGLEWRLKKDLAKGKLLIVSAIAPYWTVKYANYK